LLSVIPQVCGQPIATVRLRAAYCNRSSAGSLLQPFVCGQPIATVRLRAAYCNRSSTPFFFPSD